LLEPFWVIARRFLCPLIREADRQQSAQQWGYLLGALSRQQALVHEGVQGGRDPLSPLHVGVLGAKAEVFPEHVDEGPVAGRHAELQTASLQPMRGPPVVIRGRLQRTFPQFGDQSGLSDAGLADQGRHLASPGQDFR